MDADMTLPAGWSIGAELELADAKRDTELPGASSWDSKDYTIVNSNGVANDPTGKLWPFGGEINTEPTSSVTSQADVIATLLSSLRPAPAANYRTNFHVHVRVPGLAHDLSSVKRVLRYVARHGPRAFELVDPMPSRPTSLVYQDGPERHGAELRWRRRAVSHHMMLSDGLLRKALAATSVGAFRAAHAHVDAAGRPQYQLAARCGVNLRALWESPGQTVEFRHFCMSLNVDALHDAMRWCVVFLEAALTDGPAPDDLLWDGATFPMQPRKQPFTARWLP